MLAMLLRLLAVGVTLTVRVMLFPDWPAVMTLLLVQVTACPLALELCSKVVDEQLMEAAYS